MLSTNKSNTVAALSVLKLREMYPHVRLILVLPHRTQSKCWSKKDIAVYENIKNRADKVVYISDEFTRDCVYRRNRHFINESSVCICYLSREDSGTEKTVRAARKEGLQIINIAEKAGLQIKVKRFT